MTITIECKRKNEENKNSLASPSRVYIYKLCIIHLLIKNDSVLMESKKYEMSFHIYLLARR